MKTLLVIVGVTLLSVIRSPAEWTEDFRRIESEQVALWEQKLSEARTLAAEERPAHLWLGLRNMGHRNSLDGRSPNVQAIYYKIRDEMLSIPGHAKYFANEIKREQKEVAKYATSTGPRISYDRNRSKYFNTLSHLPSPETIAVLGEFLSDDIDTPRQKISPHSDWGENPKANSFASTFTLSAIGLREPPATKDFYDTDPDAHLSKSRAWWEEVKTGQRKFSFKGQAVEYRFKPDGTWETLAMTNPPDDGPKSAPKTTIERPIKRSAPAQADSPERPGNTSWWWFGIVGLVLLAAGAWLWKKHQSAA